MSTVTAEIPLHEQVQSFVRTPRKMLISGRWHDAASGNYLLHNFGFSVSCA
ncbi:hypothetical protein [Nitrospira sp. BLG_1]|uniref:hypothetical protein n=1 Tax=Nitrospira sp. BLG_1 TaxID=3395883 RepID=UPI0039BCEAD3